MTSKVLYISSRIPAQDARVSKLLSFSLTYLLFFLLLTFSAPFTGRFIIVAPFISGFIYFLVYGGRRLRGFMPVFWESLFSVICFYVSVMVTVWLVYKTGFDLQVDAPPIFILFQYWLTWPLFFIFVTILAFAGSVAGFIAAMSIRR
jgi:hypothetical protein